MSTTSNRLDRLSPRTARARAGTGIVTGDPTWFKDAIIYQLHVRAFSDSDADGIGDLRGLTGKLDYLQALGVTALWLLPFYPSPLRDDGYDIADYTNVHSAYGTLRDFETLLAEAHRRGLRVITELVLNHTSDQHPWFQRARRAKPGSREREMYVWSDTPGRYADARIIFKDFETSNWSWDPVANAYFWHRFYSHQPDLNYDSAAVREAMLRAVDFWFDLGVDGLRLDAVPYLYEEEGTMCENLPATHAFLQDLRRHVDARFTDRMLLAEANQWPEDAAQYFGKGDECHMAFHFPLMPRLFMGISMEDRFPLLDILEQTPVIPETCQWGLFLRNHDELTLEMVTDEERDYMYRVYAHDPQARINLGIRRRLAPLLGNHHRRIELMNGLLFSLPGTPIVYYGDEIGMGDNIYLGDRNGVRTPMQWSPDRNAGFSRCNPQRLYLPVIIDPEYHYEAVNVEALQNNPYSRLWWMRRLIALRRQFRAFGRGDLRVLQPDNRKVFAFLRRFGEECILVVANLSRFAEYVKLDLSEFEGAVPVELFSRGEFPRVTDAPYVLTLGPHAFYWFALETGRGSDGSEWTEPLTSGMPVLEAAGTWERLADEPTRARMERILAAYLPGRRWFGGKGRALRSTGIARVSGGPAGTQLVFVRAQYVEGQPEIYFLPLARATGADAERIVHLYPSAVLARVQTEAGTPDGIVYDALIDPAFATALLDVMARRRSKATAQALVGTRTDAFRRVVGENFERLEPVPMGVEQSNTSIQYGNRVIVKVFRRLQPGTNPDLEIGRVLTEQGFAHVPAVLGAAEVALDAGGEPATLAIAQEFVPTEGDGWQYTLQFLASYLERALAEQSGADAVEIPTGSVLDLAQQPAPEAAIALMPSYLQSARLLGERTAQLHLALASRVEDPAFAPEPLSTLYQRSIYQSMRSLGRRVFQLLGTQLGGFSDAVRADATRLLDLQAPLDARFKTILEGRMSGQRIRIHGDYHLGQVLYTGRDFVIIDFEGEPARSLAERRLKRSPLRDVAGMLRSFHYAAHAAVVAAEARGAAGSADGGRLALWARFWSRWAGAAYLGAYLDAAAAGGFLPHTRQEVGVLLDALLLEKAVYELGYELNNRPDWVGIPLRGLLEMLEWE